MAKEKTDSKSSSAAITDAPETEINHLDLPVKLLPEEMKLSKSLDVRRFKSADSAAEDEAISRLARTILRETQLNPCTVREYKASGGMIGYELIAGRRRRAAIELINTGAFKSLYDPKKEGPMLVECKVVEKDDESAKRAAISENIHRKDFSLMDLCLLIADVREANNWAGGEHTKDVAEYLGVSPATVTQTEKYNALSKTDKNRLHNGEITGEAALLLLNPKIVEPSKAAAVSKRADQLAAKEAEEKTAKAEAKAKEAKAKGKKSKPVKAVKKVTKEKHVKEAARENKALKAKEPRSKKDILDFFASMNGPGSPKVMAEFAAYLVDVFAKGDGTEGKLVGKWDAIADLLPKSEQAKSAKEKAA